MDSFSILIVERDTQYRDSVATALRGAGYAVETAATGSEAIEHILAQKPQLLVVDWTLPNDSAPQLCRTVRNDPALRDIIIFVLHTSNDLNTKLACFIAGATEYLIKPVTTAEIVARTKSFHDIVSDIRKGMIHIPENATSSFTAALSHPGGEEDATFGTIDFVTTGGASDSTTRIRPKYGVYRVETLIGSGAMGHVFKAYDEPLERYVALKILSRRLSNSPAFVERFRREAKVLAAINHPGIAFIYSFGEEEGEHYFAIQWCSGGSLSDMIRKKQRIDLLPAIDIVLQSAKALSAASKKGVVHRDIKPSNILFDENQQVKIVDFGLASAEKMSARITQVQEFLGTPSFMAPEQAQSSAVDYRADIYSLGITFFYMLYGKLPYNATSAIEMVIKHATQPLPAFDDLKGKIPLSAYKILEKMTQKNADNRYSDYSEIIEDLEKLRNVLLSQSHWKVPRAWNVASVPSEKSESFFELLSTIHRQGQSGILQVSWGSLQKKFLVRQREIVFFESSQPDESIWNWFVQKGLLKPEDRPPNDEPMETTLNRFLLHHVVSVEDFKVSYRNLMKAALLQIFYWPVFEGEFTPASIQNDSFAPIAISELLLDSARTVIDYQPIKEELAANRFISRTSRFEDVLSTLNLKPEESFIASRFEGKASNIETLQLLTGLPEESIARFVYALQKMGALVFKSTDEKTARKLEQPVTTQVHPALQTAPASAASPIVPREPSRPVTPAPQEQIFSPEPGQLIDLGQESDPLSTDLNGAETLRSEGKQQIDHHTRVAEQFYRLAEDKFDFGEYWHVAQLCKQAIKNNPGEAKYYHLMAKAYSRHPRFGKDAEQCFYKAIELAPRNPDYHVDLAEFYLHNGLSKRAESQLERAISLSSKNERARQMLRAVSSRNSKTI